MLTPPLSSTDSSPQIQESNGFLNHWIQTTQKWIPILVFPSFFKEESTELPGTDFFKESTHSTESTDSTESTHSTDASVLDPEACFALASALSAPSPTPYSLTPFLRCYFYSNSILLKRRRCPRPYWNPLGSESFFSEETDSTDYF